jgi:hypothetical protein
MDAIECGIVKLRRILASRLDSRLCARPTAVRPSRSPPYPISSKS